MFLILIQKLLFQKMNNQDILFTDEIWRNIVGYNGKYQISNMGRVRHNETILKPYPNSCGYLRVGLYKEGKHRKELVHRLVADAFIDNPYNLLVVNHKNEDKEDNRATNLEWATIKENMNYGSLQDRKSRSLKLAYNRRKIIY